MKYAEYVAKRTTLMAKVKEFLDASNTEDANKEMEAVKELDNRWEEIKLANANMNALNDNTKLTDIAAQGVNVVDVKEVDTTKDSKVTNEKKAYETAWAKKMLKVELNDEETKLFNKVNKITNAFTHTTSIATLIPETVVAGIEKLMIEQFPLLADVRKFNVSGNLTMNKHASIDAGDAAWYLESEVVADEENTFNQFTLTGHELAKAVTVSWKMQSMSVEEFLPFIQAELAERMGIAKATGVTKGTGVNQPKGILPTLEGQALKPQIIEFTDANGLDYTKITTAIAKIHSSLLSGVVIYANNNTVWTRLANILDGTGRPIFIPDVTSGGIGRMFGFTVKAEGSLANDEILFANAYKGYIMNTNEPMKLVSEDHAKQRETDYVAYEIVDGNVYETKAFALIKKGAGA